MHPDFIWLPGMDTPLVHTFGAMTLVGVLFALWYARRDGPRVGIDGDDAVSLGIEVFLAGLIGSRILFVYQNWGSFADGGLFDMINFRNGGLIWYGGLLSATPMAVLRARSYGLKISRVCDLFAVPVMIGLAVGRIGCLMAGDDHGRIVEEAWYTLTLPAPVDNQFGGQDFSQVKVEFTALAPTLDVALWLFDGCGINPTCLDFVNDRIGGVPETMTYRNETDQEMTVFLAVDCWRPPTESGTGYFTVKFTTDIIVPTENTSFGSLRSLYR